MAGKAQQTSLQLQLKAAEKTISVLMERMEHAIDTSGSLHNLFEDNLLLKKKISQQLRNEEQLKQFNRILEEQVALRTRELEEANSELNEKNARLKEMVRRDGLTDLYNHTAMLEIIRQKVDETKRYNHPLSLIMLDIDFFKKVNDSYGHQFGDHVLRLIAQTMLGAIRTVDFAGRFGGEEFILLLPNTTRKGAVVTAEKIRRKIARLEWEHKECRITISAGVTRFFEDTTESLIARADKLLYMAKENGRNRVVSLSYTQPELPMMLTSES